MRPPLQSLGLLPFTLLVWNSLGLAAEPIILRPHVDQPELFLEAIKSFVDKAPSFELLLKASPSLHKQTVEASEILLQVERVLTDEDETLSDGSRYDAYWFKGQAGQIIQVTLESQEFDAYLLLEDGTGKRIAENNNEGDGSNAEIVVQLLVAGRYRVLANSFDLTGQGEYRLTIASATAAELQQAELQIETDRLLQQGLDQNRLSQFTEALQSLQSALEIYRDIGDRAGEGRALGNLGIAYANQGQYPQAINRFEQSLTITREKGSHS